MGRTKFKNPFSLMIFITFIMIFIVMIIAIKGTRNALLSNADDLGTQLSEKFASKADEYLLSKKSKVSLAMKYVDEFSEKKSNESEIIDWSNYYFDVADYWRDDDFKPYIILNNKIIGENTKEYYNVNIDITKEKWYKAAYQANGSVIITNLYKSDLSGKNVVTVAAMNPKTKNGVVLECDTNIFERNADYKNFFENATYCLCDSKGNLIYSYTDNAVSQELLQQYSKKLCKKIIKNEEDINCTRSKDYNDKKCEIYYKKSDVGFNCLISVPDENLLKNDKPIIMWYIIAIIFFLVGVGIVYLFTTKFKFFNIATQTVSSLGSIYFAQFYVDLELDEYERVYADSDVKTYLSPKGKFSKIIYMDARRYIWNKDIEGVINFLQTDYIRRMLNTNTKSIDFDFRAYWNGKTIWCRISVILAGADKNGNAKKVLMTLQNITASVEADENNKNVLKEKNEKLKASMEIIQCLSDIYSTVIFLDFDEDYYRAVSLAKVIEKIMPNEGKITKILYKIMNKMVKEEYIDDLFEFIEISSMRNELSASDVISFEFQNVYDQWARISVIAMNRNADGKVYQALYTVQMIDEQKRKELETQRALREAFRAAHKASMAKTEFLSRMSHDIRTPMNAIMGMTTIAMANLNNSEKVLDSLQKISISSEHLLSILNEVLDMSRLEAGKINLEEEEFTITGLVNELKEIIYPDTENNEQNIVVNVENVFHENVLADKEKIKQAFLNILSNAVKYTPKGGEIKINVSEIEYNKPKIGCYNFEFIDNGYGIPKDFLEHVFEPFSRAEDSRVSKIRGTGLGLSITQNILRLMNGIIKVESEEGKGTKFEVRVLFKLSYNADKKEETLEENNSIDYSGKRVLLVDDNELNREIAVELLSMYNIIVEEAENGKIAADMFLKSSEFYYDLILMDIQMPVMNGYEATKQIRSMVREDSKKIPIFAVTANAFADDIEDAKKAGMNEHIPKPFDINKLIKLLKKYFEANA